MNLLLSIYSLGFVKGFKYWRLNRYYSKHPDQLQEFINTMRQKAILDPHNPWGDFANQCQKSLDAWKKKNHLRR